MELKYKKKSFVVPRKVKEMFFTFFETEDELDNKIAVYYKLISRLTR